MGPLVPSCGPQVKKPCLNKNGHNEPTKKTHKTKQNLGKEKREFPERGICATSPSGPQAGFCPTHGNPRWRPHQQMRLDLLPLHRMTLPPPHPKETRLSSEDTASPFGCSEQRLFFLIPLVSQQAFFWGGVQGGLEIPLVPHYCF